MLLNRFFKYLKDLYNGQLGQKQIVISSISETDQFATINCESMLSNWLNAYEYHQEEEKQKLIEDIERGLPTGFLRSVFMDMIIEKIKSITYFYGLIDRLDSGDGKITVYL